MRRFAFVAALAIAVPAVALPLGSGPFNGPFVGIQGGWQQDDQKLQTLDRLGFVATTRRAGSGFAYGGEAGWDFRLLPNLVLGGEVGVTGRTDDDGLIDPSGNAYDLRLGRTIDATGRVGLVVPGPGGLAYVRGGYSNARFNLSDVVARNGFDRDGYTVGAGYEQPLTRHVNARLEYDYSDYGRDTLSQTAADDGFADARERFHRNAVKAGIDLHF